MQRPDPPAAIEDRFVCRREGHEPAIKVVAMCGTLVGAESYFTSCARCGKAIEVPLPRPKAVRS